MRSEFVHRLRRFGRTAIFTAAVAFLGRTSQQVFAVALVLIAAAFLTPAEYGVYSLATALAILLQTFTYAGFYHFIVRQDDPLGTLLDTCFWCMMAVALLGAGALFGAGPFLSSAFDAPSFFTALSILALDQVLGTPIAWISAVMLRRQQLRPLYAIMLVQNVLSFAAGLIFLLYWHSVAALLAYRVTKTGLGLILYFSHTRICPGLKFSPTLALSAFRYASGLYGSRIMHFLSRYSGDLLLGLMFSTAEAGLFRFGNRVVTGITDVISQPIKSFALTQFGDAQRRDGDFAAIYARFASTTLMLLGITCIAIALLVGPAVHAFLAPHYFEAIGVTRAICVATAATIGGMFLEPILSARGKTASYFLLTTASAAIAIAAIALAAPVGLLAVAWSQSVVTMMSGVLGMTFIARYMPAPLSVLVKPLAGTIPYLVAFGLGAFAIDGAARWAISAGPYEVVVAAALMGLLAGSLLWLGSRAGVVSMEVFVDSSGGRDEQVE
ncbi:oligosaccharide flippase family protein [Sinorhizobium fredii]|uniref:Polysaccharide biosynthesis protein n=1 Tax=Rhizobium fredii TaxID=380 RepID=A0A2A6M7N9_RHIFR|nr:oligosaccharide flippase family protein [Sinorhizobium fredii]PDT50409.1 polysaccharide biosynthesis protein [Sinorhizobium fredii]